MSRASQINAIARELGNPHVSSKMVENSAGFGNGPQPPTTAGFNPTGKMAGAPYHSKEVKTDGITKTVSGLKDNPTNPFDTDSPGVLGDMIVSGVAPPLSSPVPSTAGHMPDRYGNYKADAVASVTKDTPVGQPVKFPADGVLGRS